jgi:hypothetical protein
LEGQWHRLARLQCEVQSGIARFPPFIGALHWERINGRGKPNYGDYAQLDYGGLSCLWWLGQAGVLILVIPLCILVICWCSRKAQAVWVVDTKETCASIDAVTISIVNYPEKTKFGCAIGDVGYVGRGENNASPRSHIRFFTCRDREGSSAWGWSENKCESSGIWCSFGSGKDIDPQLLDDCLRLADVGGVKFGGCLAIGLRGRRKGITQSHLWSVSGNELVSGDFPQIVGAKPQRTSSEEQKKGEQSQQRIGNFQAQAEERRPILGSFLIAALSLLGGLVAQVYSYGLWNRHRYFAGLIMWLISFFLGFEGSIGFLLRIDLWSLGERWL